MRKYVFIDKTKKTVEQILQWGDDRKLPVDYPIDENQKIIIVDDSLLVGIDDVYDNLTGLFYVLEPLDIVIVPTELELLQAKVNELEQTLSTLQPK